MFGCKFNNEVGEAFGGGKVGNDRETESGVGCAGETAQGVGGAATHNVPLNEVAGAVEDEFDMLSVLNHAVLDECGDGLVVVAAEFERAGDEELGVGRVGRF